MADLRNYVTIASGVLSLASAILMYLFSKRDKVKTYKIFLNRSQLGTVNKARNCIAENEILFFPAAVMDDDIKQVMHVIQDYVQAKAIHDKKMRDFSESLGALCLKIEFETDIKGMGWPILRKYLEVAERNTTLMPHIAAFAGERKSVLSPAVRAIFRV